MFFCFVLVMNWFSFINFRCLQRKIHNHVITKKENIFKCYAQQDEYESIELMSAHVNFFVITSSSWIFRVQLTLLLLLLVLLVKHNTGTFD